ncbi:alpha beta hydrolase fold protein [Diplodia corticola]|uniref:Alpha beta hydrolase fold protein n=1 Tax=Diplodia corticola TaxID=236234 RepID=A0A1J9QJJ0_9PEZI|nr:alpha beta hydrolase fold protein [Diplodia corticola]OJD28648.1 alpha beta hydrolase fold protein [Diplodia corticola]
MPGPDLLFPSSNGPTDPLPSAPIRFPRNLADFCAVWTLKSVVHVYTSLLRLLSLLRLRPRPSLTRTYPCAPHSPVRIFLPSASPRGTATSPPLLISVHGGGFALGAPTVDDADALLYAHNHRIAVANVGYRLAPRSRFPNQVHDVAALVEAILDDPLLPVDRSRVAICGYSAGGNLCLAASQLRGLSESGRIKGAVSFYPVVDFALDHAARVARAQASVARDAPNQSFGWVRWGYVPERQDLRDPLLSPVFAPRSKLPQKICLIGCELDMLCDEAERMAEQLAAEEGEGSKMPEGESGWRTRNVRWEKVLAQPHGFNQMVAIGEKRSSARRRTEKMHAEVAKWLFEEVFV